MEPSGQSADSGPAPRAYLYQAPEEGAQVFIDFDVIDRLGSDFLRGLSAIPRRGMEVGGILLGFVERTAPLTIRIEDCLPIPCEHLYGPSFILSPKDRETLDDLLARWTTAPDRRLYAVGFYRSHTREPFELGEEDIGILDSCFPDPAAICLLVRPFATRPGEASILFRRDAAFPRVPPDTTFPFRRRELGGGRPPRPPREPQGNADAAQDAASPPAGADAPPPSSPLAAVLPKTRAGWIWLPLSFIFLLLGVVLGFQVALTFSQPKAASPPADPYGLGLSAVQFGDSIHLKWNTASPAVQSAQRAVLTIRDEANTKIIELQKEDLAQGAIIYRYVSSNVGFRLEAFLSDRNGVLETLDLRLLPPPSPPPAPSKSPAP